MNASSSSSSLPQKSLIATLCKAVHALTAALMTEAEAVNVFSPFITFLATPEAGYANGAYFVVDGGLTVT